MKLRHLLLTSLVFASAAHAQTYTKSDLYRLTHQIERTLDESQIDSGRAQQAAAALIEAKRLIATGISTPASLVISDGTTYNYGTLATGGTADHTFTVTNIGGWAASRLAGSGLFAPFTFKGGSFPGTGGTCGVSMGASMTCTIVVTYSPTTVGTHNATVSLAYHDGNSTQVSTRALIGTGAAPALLSFSDGPTYDFGAVSPGNPVVKSFTITNSGGLAASAISFVGLSTPYTFRGGSSPGVGGNCGASLNPSASCTVVVEFLPATRGVFSATLNALYNDGATSQSSTRALEGTGR